MSPSAGGQTGTDSEFSARGENENVSPQFVLYSGFERWGVAQTDTKGSGSITARHLKASVACSETRKAPILFCQWGLSLTAGTGDRGQLCAKNPANQNPRPAGVHRPTMARRESIHQIGFIVWSGNEAVGIRSPAVHIERQADEALSIHVHVRPGSRPRRRLFDLRAVGASGAPHCGQPFYAGQRACGF